jgi:hypothetical protein
VPVVIGLVVLVVGAMAIAGGLNWMLVHLDIVIYVAVGLVLLRWAYVWLHERVRRWAERQQLRAAAAQRLAAERADHAEKMQAQAQRLDKARLHLHRLQEQTRLALAQAIISGHMHTNAGDETAD